MRKFSKVLSFILVICLLSGLLPSKMYAAETPFKDVAQNEWYGDAVKYVYDNDLMNGVSSTAFEPEGTTTRGMIVTILHRMAGLPKQAAEKEFTDVPDDQWYSDAVSWATATGVTEGYGNGLFGPEDPITREQFASVLFRYASLNNGASQPQTDALNHFSDAGDISSYALTPLKWAVGSGLINGINDSLLSPGGYATRAQSAMILMRFRESTDPGVSGQQISGLDNNSLAPQGNASDAITITAGTTKTVTVKAKQTDPSPGSSSDPAPGTVDSGSLSLSSLHFSINRDYEQQCMITVYNDFDEPIEFYLDVINNYSDISMEIIRAGSRNNPAIIPPGGNTNVELSVFAQNAERAEYEIPLKTCILYDGKYIEYSKDSVFLSCDIPVLNLAWARKSSSETTLSQTWEIRNNGDTLTDLSLFADETLSDYLTFSPIISNYELLAGRTVAFDVYPDLAKMKKDGVSRLEGTLIASCAGKTSEQAVVFDTQGKDITVTTMGQLALQQSGNPFTKFEPIEDSFSVQYSDGSGYQDIAADSSLEDLLDDDYLLDILYKSEVDLGVGAPAKINYSITSSEISSADAASLDLSPIITDDGTTVSVTSRIVMTRDEYAAFLNDSYSSSNNRAGRLIKLSPSSATTSNSDYIEIPVRDGIDFFVTQTTTLNDYIDLVTNVVPQPPVITGPQVLGMVYDATGLMMDTGIAMAFNADPRYDNAAKVQYNAAVITKTVLTVAKHAVTIANPLAGFALGFALDFIIEPFLDMMKANAVSMINTPSIYHRYLGSQCTNRGSISTSFYVPNYNRNTSKPTVRATGRMYGDGYVNNTNTNYDIFLNGQPAGRVSNEGLTEVTFAEIPSDNLMPGKTNEIIFVYDTSPGSHSVSTDTEIALLYTPDSEIAYIDSPDDLQDVRAKPDFCVYPENIFKMGDYIIGERGKHYVKVYNRGSSGGWVNITCYEGSRQIYSETNCYMDPFSVKNIEVDWTPSAQQSTFRVELVNASVNLEDRDTTNNSASKTVTARSREIPEIRNFSSGTIMASTPFSVSLDVYKHKDVTGAEFMLDGTTEPSYVGISEAEDHQRYLLTFENGLTGGDHTINASISFKTSSGNQTLDGSFNLSVVSEADSYLTLSLDEGITDPVFSVFRYSSLVNTAFEHIGNGTYRCLKTADMYNNPNEYVIIVSYDSGIIITDMSQSGQTINDAGCNKLFIQKNEQDIIRSAEVVRASKDGSSNYDLYMPVSPDKPISLTPGIYSVRLDGTIDGAAFYRTKTVDVTESDQTIDTGEFASFYFFNVANPGSGRFNAAMHYKDSSNAYWHTNWIATEYDKVNQVLRCHTTHSWLIDEVNNSEEAYISINSSNELFTFKLRESGQDIVSPVTSGTNNHQQNTKLDRADLNRVTLACNDDAWNVGNVSVQWNRMSASLFGDTIFIPDGDYSFSTVLSSDNTTMFSSTAATVDTDCEVIVDQELSDVRDVTITWPETFNELGTVRSSTNAGSSIAVSGFNNGNSIKVQKGTRRFNVNLSYQDDVFSFSKELAVGDENNELIIGNKLSGSIEPYFNNEYNGGDTTVLNLNNVVDEHGNRLDNISAYNVPIQGYATFVDTNDESRVFTTPLTAASLYQINVTMPEESGTFKMSVTLTTNNTCRVVFDSQGGSFVANGITEPGKAVSRPDDPVRTNYVFGGWYLSTDYNVPYDFNTPVTSDITLYAKWTPGKTDDTVDDNNGNDNNHNENNGQNNNETVDRNDNDNRNEQKPVDSYPVSLPSKVDNGQVTVRPRSARAGEVVTIIPVPEEDYEVDTVKVTDRSGREIATTRNNDGSYSFTMPDGRVNVSVTYKAKTGTLADTGHDCMAKQFTDVDIDKWYHEGIDFVVERGLMVGVSRDKFAPDADTTRAMIVTILHRLEGEPVSSTPDSFSDVEGNAWYSNAIAWANASGIVKGYGSGIFGPADTITREQMATILHRYAAFKKREVGQGADLSGFVDRHSINDYAVEAVRWAVAENLLQGVGNSSFSPGTSATRGQVATILMRYHEKVK